MYVFEDTNRPVNEWLVHRMDEAPFHKLCYSSAMRRISTCHRSLPWMTTLHILTRNPLAPPETITALLDVNVEVAFCFDNWEKIPLEYARDYKIGGLIGMISGVCNPRYANTWKRRGTDNFQIYLSRILNLLPRHLNIERDRHKTKYRNRTHECAPWYWSGANYAIVCEEVVNIRLKSIQFCGKCSW